MPKFKSLSDIRRSIKGDLPPPPPSRLNAGVPSAMIPPKKVIKALYDFNAESPNELSFRAGDFFHVIGNENDVNWYEAHNPLTNARGMVPVKYFQELGRQASSPPSATPPALPPIASGMSRFSNVDDIIGNGSADFSYNNNNGNSHHSQHQHSNSSGSAMGGAGNSFRSPPNSAGGNRRTNSSLSSNSGAGASGDYRGHRSRPSNSSHLSASGMAHSLHGVVMYDFTAERPNELGAQAGDDILIVAQSHEDWFVAKFINRLGGPGLIPVSYVEVRDPETNEPTEDLYGLMERLQIVLPTVEDWKRQMMQQEQAGLINNNGSGNGNSNHQGSSGGLARTGSGSGQLYNSEIVDTACIESYITQEMQFWFLIRLFMRDGSQRTVYRVYEDFYAFQIALLDSFPEEAGRTGRRRILPYMPAPISVVDENVTAERCGFLDTYIKELCEVPEYIRNSQLVRKFFGLEEDDDDEPEESEQDGQRHRHTASNGSSGGHHRRPSPPNSSSGGVISPISETPSATGMTSSNSNMLKVKLMHNDDLIAIRVPANITYVALWEKVFERLGSTVRAVSWKTPSGDWSTLDSEEDLRQALAETGGKLTLHAT
ncbi:hypothetical protein BDF22DRAFT_701102 [Syncephalis plumigaleata]|nr:hypothetical protein BDF22DRAFT_701102 [Syncephalis plumigaleata]